MITTTISSLFIILPFFFFQIIAANSVCSPSSCGVVRNISSPFRLKSDPIHCGDPRYELSCENNVTFLYLNSHRYYVKEINYLTATIRVVDASINNDTCSFSNYTFIPDHDSPYRIYTYTWTLYFMSCRNPLHDSSLFTDITQYCASSNYSHRYYYIKIKADYIKVSDIQHMCRLDLTALTSWKFNGSSNVSLSEIHQSLLYGFDLLFPWSKTTTTWKKFTDRILGNGPLLIPLAILVFLIAGVSLPVTIIIGLIGVLVLSFVSLDGYWPNLLTNHFFLHGVGVGSNYWSLILVLLVISLAIVVCFITAANLLVAITVGCAGALLLYFIWKTSMNSSLGLDTTDRERKPVFTAAISGIVICIPRFIICPFAMWFLIYKFRRRRLSTFDAIESYLQGDNKLAPIRYSYSDLKKMTKGFQEKLGEGGYGSVYKGKLRSGHHVAIKLLGKRVGNGQDFMNEIATIGRIHHVNVVRLVGYCAERTKRALVFDFMPKGSLDKYIFNRDQMNSLSWDIKFEIAVGVARGMQYLHQGCDVQILHFDIKPHNILLDDKFIPKISDFGLAKFFSTDKNSVAITAARGTIGYVAPELINRSIGAVSYKADVYSFGMLLMEMVGLNKGMMRNSNDSSRYFPYWIYDHFNHGKVFEIENANENDDNDSIRKVGRKMRIVALWCIQMNPNDRPSMDKVLGMLEGDVERLQIPKYPSESTQIVLNTDETGTASSTGSVSLPYHNAVSQPSVEIIVEELQSSP